jgi:hypothetical protein
MFHYSTIILDPDNREIVLNGISPFSLSIDPQNTDRGLKTYKIVYDFDDDSAIITKLLAAMPSAKNDYLKYPYEILDPRNQILTHSLILRQEISRTFNINIKVYSILNPIIGSGEVPNYTEYKITLNLEAPILDTASIATSGNYFEEMHLVNTRMFGADNTILYNFESENPHYLLPTLVKWHNLYSDLNPPPFLFDPEYSPRGMYPR